MIILAIVTLILMVILFLIYSVNQIENVGGYGDESYNEPSEMFSFDKSVNDAQ